MPFRFPASLAVSTLVSLLLLCSCQYEYSYTLDLPDTAHDSSAPSSGNFSPSDSGAIATGATSSGARSPAPKASAAPGMVNIWDGKDFALSYKDLESNGQYLYEYVPSGQSPDDWTEMLTLLDYRNSETMPAQLVGTIGVMIASNNGKIFSTVNRMHAFSEELNANAVIYEMIVSEGGKRWIELTMQKFFTQDGTTRMASYAKKIFLSEDETTFDKYIPRLSEEVRRLDGKMDEFIRTRFVSPSAASRHARPNGGARLN